MKTAVSIPDNVFDAAEQVSKRLGVSRSRLYAIAIERLLARERSRGVRKALDRSDRVRTEALKAMFVRFGYEDEDALVRARVLYYMQIGYYALDLDEPIEARLNLTPHYLKAFTGAAPSEAEVVAFRAYAARHSHVPDFGSPRGRP